MLALLPAARPGRALMRPARLARPALMRPALALPARLARLLPGPATLFRPASTAMLPTACTACTWPAAAWPSTTTSTRPLLTTL